MNARIRFRRNERSPGPGGKVRNRPGHEDPRVFLARLTALFGPPDQIDAEGFEYFIYDEKTGLAFSAYSGASGPAYGAVRTAREALRPVLEAFDALLDATMPDHDRLAAAPAPNPLSLARSLEEAEAASVRPSDDPWEPLGPLASLCDAWARAGEADRGAHGARATELAGRLLEATLQAAVRVVGRAADDPIRAPFVDAGLDQLRAIAGSPLLEGQDTARRVEEISHEVSSQ